MARKKARKTTKGKARRKTTARRGGPLASLSSKVSGLSSRVAHLEERAVMKKVKHHGPRTFAGTADEVY
jgi:hypothetical protein